MMKRQSIRASILLIALSALSACNLSSGGESALGAPVVEIAAGIGSVPYQLGVTVNIQAAIGNATSDIHTVEISVDNAVIVTLDDPNPQNAASFVVSQAWQADAPGSRILRVVATRKDGTRGEDSVTLTVVDALTGGDGGVIAPATRAPQLMSTATPATATNASVTNTPRPTLTATQAAGGGTGGAPVVIFTQQQNVRNGPGTEFLIVGTASIGERAPITALNLDATWYNITFLGQSAWVYAPLTDLEGSLAGLQRIVGPPTPIPPPTRISTAIPPATATSVQLPNLAISDIAITVPSDGSFQPKCGVPFTARVTIRNTSNVATTTGLTLIQNIHVASGTVTGSSGQALVPVTLDPGGSHTVEYTFTIDTFFGQEQRVTFYADANGEVAESNENDNQNGISYTLEQAGCR